MKKVFISLALLMATAAQADELMVMSCSFYKNQDISEMTGYVVTQNEKAIKIYSIDQGTIKKEYSASLPSFMTWDQVSTDMTQQLKKKLRRSVIRETAFVKILDMSVVHSGKVLVNLYNKDRANLGGLVINENWLERKCYPADKN